MLNTYILKIKQWAYNISPNLLKSTFIGNRVLVSLRNIDEFRNETYTGFLGVIYSLSDDGILLEIEYGIDDKFWMLPPDIEMLQPAQSKSYEMKNGTIVKDIDYECYLSMAQSVEDLENRSSY